MLGSHLHCDSYTHLHTQTHTLFTTSHLNLYFMSVSKQENMSCRRKVSGPSYFFYFSMWSIIIQLISLLFVYLFNWCIKNRWPHLSFSGSLGLALYLKVYSNTHRHQLHDEFNYIDDQWSVIIFIIFCCPVV